MNEIHEYNEWVVPVVGLILIIGVIIGIGCAIEFSDDRKFNDGYCQTCGEVVQPVGHAYSTDYYCASCKKYNK